MTALNACDAGGRLSGEASRAAGTGNQGSACKTHGAAYSPSADRYYVRTVYPPNRFGGLGKAPPLRWGLVYRG